MKTIYKYKEFKLFCLLVSIISLGIFIQSCSKEDEFDDEFSATSTTAVDWKKKKETEKANKIASQYMELVGRQYVLNLSEEEALSLGISKSEYERMQKEIFDVNAYTLELEAKGMVFDLSDPKMSRIDNSNIRLKQDSGPGSTSETYRIGSNVENVQTKVAESTSLTIGYTPNCNNEKSNALVTVHYGNSSNINISSQSTNMTAGGVYGPTATQTFTSPQGLYITYYTIQSNCSHGGATVTQTYR